MKSVNTALQLSVMSNKITGCFFRGLMMEGQKKEKNLYKTGQRNIWHRSDVKILMEEDSD